MEKKKGKSVGQIHDRISMVMKTLKYDEASFARKIGVSKPAVITVITKAGDPSYAMIKNIATILPVSQEWLYMGTGTPWTVSDLTKFKSDSGPEDSHRDVDEGINNRMKMIRMHLRFTQAMFAGELKISRDVITGIETFRSSPSAVVIKRVCLNFHISPTWIILGEGDQHTRKR
jgi:transcriptional regulator with XRE-family HTH domain